MESISNVFLCKLSLIKLSKFNRSGKQDAWRVKNSSKKGAIEVVNYFSKFPLFSSKYLCVAFFMLKRSSNFNRD